VSPPRVSVLMAVHNGGPRLRRSINSILQQAFGDLELIVVDDGSTDDTAAVLEGIGDPRLKVVHQKHRGLTASLNTALEHARGELLARQDCGDDSRPQRLARQVALFDRNPRLGLVSTWAVNVLPDRRPFTTEHRPRENDTIQRELLVLNCVFGAAAMFRRSAVDAVGPYCEAFRYAQDYDLHLRIAERFEVANIPEVLYECEAPLADAISFANVAEQRTCARVAVELARRRRAGESLSPPEIRRVCESRLAALRRVDRRLAQALSLTYWARSMWDHALRGQAVWLFARALGLVAMHPRAWGTAAAPIVDFGRYLVRRKWQRWAGGVEKRPA